MKRSQIALLSMAGILAGIVVATVVSARIALSLDRTAFVDRAQVSASTELRGFREIEVAGNWQVNVNRGGDWQVDLSYPGGFEDRLEVHVVGDRLRLGIQSDSWLDEPDFSPSADIVMPALEEVDVKGSAKLELAGFRGRRLEIDIAGASHLTGRDGHFDALELSVAGGSGPSMSSTPLTPRRRQGAGRRFYCRMAMADGTGIII